MKYKINYAIGGALQPIVTPIQTLPQDNMNITLEGLTNKEIIKTCSLNKIFCQKMNWENLIRDRNINIESVLNLDELEGIASIMHPEVPTMCEHISDIQRPYCRDFYNYTKYYKYTKHFNTIAAGGGHSMALQNDGTVRVWGEDLAGQRDNIPDGLNNVVSIAAGSEHSMALQNDGTVRVWGRNDRGQCNVPDGLNNVVSIAAGSHHSMVLKNDGTVRVWGGTGFPLDIEGLIPANLNNIVSIAAGRNFSMILQNDGTVRVWGRNDEGQRDVPADLIARLP